MNETHAFYCIRCGNKGIPIVRNSASKREKGHLKRLYCVYCNKEVNHYECRDEQDVIDFRKKYEKGDFDGE